MPRNVFMSVFSPRTHNVCQFVWAHNKVTWLIRLHIMLCSVMWLFASYLCDPTARQDKTVVGVINQLINQLLCINAHSQRHLKACPSALEGNTEIKFFCVSFCFFWNSISIYTLHSPLKYERAEMRAGRLSLSVITIHYFTLSNLMCCLHRQKLSCTAPPVMELQSAWANFIGPECWRDCNWDGV